jgi:hypothetical protein
MQICLTLKNWTWVEILGLILGSSTRAYLVLNIIVKQPAIFVMIKGEVSCLPTMSSSCLTSKY